MDATPLLPPTLPKAIAGPALRHAFAAASRWLDRHVDAINALNVFPVPDGDTGLNLSLTLRSAVEAASERSDTTCAEVTAALAHGALMGARGNSGVILAQYLRGVATALHEENTLDSTLLARGFRAGASAAYRAVQPALEGTILSVAAAAATAGETAAGAGKDIVECLETVHAAARIAVDQTPSQLAVLRQAGVVDAGGEGLRVIFEGLLRFTRGESDADGSISVTVKADLSAFHEIIDGELGYCTEVLFRGPSVDQERIRAILTTLGTSILIVGDDELTKVHVHTERPGDVLNLATDLGAIVKVKVDNLQAQFQEFNRTSRSDAPGRVEPGTSLVVVAAGDGFIRLFSSLGAQVVTGHQTMNPSVEQIIAGIERAPRSDVLVATNDSNVVLAAEQAAAAVAPRLVRVLNTRTMAQGVAVALALAPLDDLDANGPRAATAVAKCHVLQIARAARTAEVDTITVAANNFFALLDGQAVATDTSVLATVRLAAAALTRSGVQLPFEIATVYVGADGSEPEGQVLASLLRELGTADEVVVESGGQPHFQYLIGIE